MKNKITGFLVAFVGFGLVFSSGLGIYITETQDQDDTTLENITDQTKTIKAMMTKMIIKMTKMS
jgi:hypothetical protein